MSLDVIELTSELIRFKSVTRWSNAPVADYLEKVLEQLGCEIERGEYVDLNGELKVNLIGKLGDGEGGLAFCSHNDVVPGQEQDWPAFEPEIRDGKLYGRGSCDMKGPLAATLVAAQSVDASKLKKPVYIVLTADEEIGLIGAKKMVESSKMLAEANIEHGVIAEPTRMVPVYSHKGFAQVTVVSTGFAAHSSTGRGESAVLKAAPFLNYLYELDQTLKTDKSFQNDEYNPPHQTLNLTVDSGEAALNVTAPKTVIKISLRAMPNSRSEELVEMIVEKARSYGFEAEGIYGDALVAPLSAELVTHAVALTESEPETVSYGTDGMFLKEAIRDLVILGPGDIAVAHTVGEHIELKQLHEAVDVYKGLIHRLCM